MEKNINLITTETNTPVLLFMVISLSADKEKLNVKQY